MQHSMAEGTHSYYDWQVSTLMLAYDTVEPLDRGFGYTFGNSLRRVLLSSLEGAAVTSVKIEGVAHEFTTLPGVREDVTDVILNLKNLICLLHGESPEVEVHIAKKGAGPVTAADIQAPADLEILNPELEIGNLEAGHRLDMVLSDAPIGTGVHVRGFNHLLGESATSFFAVGPLAARVRRRFLARHPKSKLYADFADFSFWRLDVARVCLSCAAHSLVGRSAAFAPGCRTSATRPLPSPQPGTTSSSRSPSRSRPSASARARRSPP